MVANDSCFSDVLHVDDEGCQVMKCADLTDQQPVAGARDGWTLRRAATPPVEHANIGMNDESVHNDSVTSCISHNNDNDITVTNAICNDDIDNCADAQHKFTDILDEDHICLITNMEAEDAPQAVLSWSAPSGKIVSTRLDKLNSVPIALNGHVSRAMLDSGASVNCVKLALLEALDLHSLIDTEYAKPVWDAQGRDMGVVGQVQLIVTIADTQIPVDFVVMNRLPLPVLLGVPFMASSKARMDYGGGFMSIPSEMDDGETPSVVMTAVTKPLIAFYAAHDVEFEPQQESFMLCVARETMPMLVDSENADKPNWTTLSVLRSDLLQTHKSLIVKPSFAHRRPDGTYIVHVINPLSTTVSVSRDQYITDAGEAPTQKPREILPLPDCIVLDRENCLDRPIDYIPYHEHIDTTGRSWPDDAILNEKWVQTTDQRHVVAAIQILWPEQAYCPPVAVDETTRTTRTMACQTEVDIGNQTRILTFKEINWTDFPGVTSEFPAYQDELIDLLDKHRPAFAADLTEIAIMEGVYYRVDLNMMPRQ